ncbi:MAG: thioesterase family protein [Spirochaetota bacterium]
MYTKKFEVRWNDMDANNHLANSTYIQFMSHTRMSFFKENNLSLQDMNSYGLGPIVFYEHIYYFKETHMGDHVIVSLEVKGRNKDGRFILIEHNFYDEKGVNLANSEMLLSWINMETRKLAKVPPDLFAKIEAFPQSADFEILTPEVIKKYLKRPKNLEF